MTIEERLQQTYTAFAKIRLSNCEDYAIKLFPKG